MPRVNAVRRPRKGGRYVEAWRAGVGRQGAIWEPVLPHVPDGLKAPEPGGATGNGDIHLDIINFSAYAKSRFNQAFTTYPALTLVLLA